MKLRLVVGSVALAAGLYGCSDATEEPPLGGTGGSTTSTGGLGSSGAGAGTSTGGTSTGGVASTGGTVATGGVATTGGTPSTGGSSATGGSSSTGGSTNTGGTNATGGTNTTGGKANGGGANSTGGKAGTGGANTTGGKASTGGANATGGKASTGGASATGGTANTGGSGTTGGKASTGGTATCDSSWNPPDTANGNTGVIAGLAKEWARTGPATLKAKDTKMHQLMDNGGKMRYCARWDSSSPISAQERQQAAALMRKCDLQWTDKLKGWGCWPYDTIDVKIVMWVVRDASLLVDWNASEGSYVVGKVSTNDDADVACPSSCRQVPGQTQKTSCAEGQVFDEYLWLDGDKTDYTGWGFAGGFYMSAQHFMSAAKANANTETIVAHELGHAHSLNDFYNAGEVPAGWTHFIMMSGSSSVVTDTDGWMLRDAWRHIRSQWGLPAAQ